MMLIGLLCGACAFLVLAVILLAGKVISLRRAADELRAEFAARLTEDTNVGIDLATGDGKMRALAAAIDHQLKLLRKAQLNYQQGDRELKEAVTNISHDLRTPLTAICGYMELLEREELPESARRYLAVIGNRVEALKYLTEELLRYSVVVSGGESAAAEGLSLNQAVEECVAAYYGLLIERGIEPEVALPGERVERTLGKASLARVLGNILTNAVKYSNGDLRVTLSGEGTVTFANHTNRLDEVALGRLFDRFFTVENGSGGVGLGLSIAKVLTEQMGGMIDATLEDGLFSIRVHFPA